MTRAALIAQRLRPRDMEAATEAVGEGNTEAVGADDIARSPLLTQQLDAAVLAGIQQCGAFAPSDCYLTD